MSKFSIIIPTEFAAEIKFAAESFTEWFGGATVQAGQGWWHSSKNGLVQEPVTVVWSFGEAAQGFKVGALARTIARHTAQECVLWFAEDGTPHFETGAGADAA